MQLLGTHSEEGDLPGLGWLDAASVRFSVPDVEQPKRKIPHMGWNSVSATDGSPLFAGFETDPRFYFVHSFHVVCKQPQNVSGTVSYGTTVTAAVRKNHIFGVQFHPEKSHKYGINLLRSFAGISKTQQGS
jgi:glutamine amidotransferase